MLKLAIGMALAAVATAQVPPVGASARPPSPGTPPPTTISQIVVAAPTASTCEIPWPVNGMGRWTDCTPELTKAEGEACTFESPLQYDCVYPDGAILCNKDGKFEQYDENGKSKGPNYCTKIPHPADGLGCARHDKDDQACTSTPGCHWDAERSWCAINCRKVSCGAEFHRRDIACQFNCPLHNATACKSWQAGCSCIQDADDTLKSCDQWCTTTNAQEFIWLPTATTSSVTINPASTALVKAVNMAVMDSMAVTNEAGYDPLKLCQDACFQRGVCISPKVVV